MDQYIPDNFRLLEDNPFRHDSRSAYLCNQCHSHIFDDTSPDPYVQEANERQLLHDRLIIKQVYCIVCSAFVGFKVVNFMPSQSQHTSNGLSNNHEIYEINSFKNYLLEIENNLNARFERQNYSKFVTTNQKYIGKYFICLSNVSVV
ncbi:hypothetical protein SBY92_002234 [Candida maltosa Xu316]